MIVDSSVLVAVLWGEDDAPDPMDTLVSAEVVRISAAILLEASIVVTPAMHPELDDLLSAAGAEVVAFDADQARSARAAHARLSRGSGSPARLNFGGCFSYALARVSGEPLLFEGDDFTHTDVVPAR